MSNKKIFRLKLLQIKNGQFHIEGFIKAIESGDPTVGGDNDMVKMIMGKVANDCKDVKNADKYNFKMYLIMRILIYSNFVIDASCQRT